MANIDIAKDEHSFFIATMLNADDTITYDFTLSKSYTVVVMKGIIDVGPTEQRTAPGMYRVAPGEKLTASAIGDEAIIMTPFLLNDTETMDELVPDVQTFTDLMADDGQLMDVVFSNPVWVIAQKSTFGTDTNLILTTDSLGVKINERMSA